MEKNQGFNQIEWANFVERYYEGIFSYAFLFLRNRAEAEDVTQDVFLKAQLAIVEGAVINNEKAWIYSIVRNACIDRTRWWKRWKYGKVDEELPQKGSDMELVNSIKDLVSKLPVRQREVFILRHWHGFSTEETAKFLSIDEGSIKSHLSRSIGKLKDALKG